MKYIFNCFSLPTTCLLELTCPIVCESLHFLSPSSFLDKLRFHPIIGESSPSLPSRSQALAPAIITPAPPPNTPPPLPTSAPLYHCSSTRPCGLPPWKSSGAASPSGSPTSTSRLCWSLYSSTRSPVQIPMTKSTICKPEFSAAFGKDNFIALLLA